MAPGKALTMSDWGFSTCFILLVLVSVAASPAIAQEDPHGVSIDDLIAKLDSRSFVEREDATAALIEKGEPAVERILSVSTNATFEVRQRGKIVEQKVAERIFEQRSSKFLRDLDPMNAYDLPGWHAFRELVGSTRTSKLLFLEMLKHDRSVATLVEEFEQMRQMSVNDETGAAAKQKEIFALATRKAEHLQSRLFSIPTPEVGESISILFASAMLDEGAPVEANRVIAGVAQMSFHGYLQKPGFNQCIKKLLSAWVPKTHGAMAPEVMYLSLKIELPVIVSIARQNLTKNLDVSTRALAFQCLATFGDKSDIARLLEYTEETTIVEQFSDSTSGITETRAAPPGIPFIPGQQDNLQFNNRIVRINDLAAVSAMLLLNEDPVTIFPNYSHDKVQRIYVHDLAISEQDSADRIASIQAWAEARSK